MEDYETDAIKKTKDIPGLTFAMFEVPTHPNTDVKCLVCLVCIVYTIAITWICCCDGCSSTKIT